MNHTTPRAPHQTLRMARQELRTLTLLGIPWAHLAPQEVTAGVAVEDSPPRREPTPRTPPAPTTTIEPKPAPRPAPRPTPATATKPAAHPPLTLSPATGEKHERLAELRERYERESLVAQRITGWNNIVFADGDPDAQLMFIGEAPGEDEDIQGLPFVGRAGKKLNDMIRAMGYARESVYIANILKVRPPNNRTPTAEEAELDGPFLLEQIGIVRPRVIVTLGKPAAHYLLRETRPMGQLRGTWHEHNGIPVMPTYHPAFLLRAYTPENRQKVWSDLQQVVTKLQSLTN